MKKKIFIAMATLFFAAIAFYNVQVSHQNGDISLEHVALMAQANSESGSKNCPGTAYEFCAAERCWPQVEPGYVHYCL